MTLLDIYFYITAQFNRAKVTGVIRRLNPDGFGGFSEQKKNLEKPSRNKLGSML